LKIVIFVYHIVESIAEERPAIGLNHVIYNIAENYTCSGLHTIMSLTTMRMYRLAVVASQIPNLRNSEKVRSYSNSRSSEVIDFGANGERIIMQLAIIVFNTNFGRISYRFRDTRYWRI